MLTARDICKSFGGFKALNRCSLSVQAGSVTGIIGPNGAGKSTLFSILGGLLCPDSGDVEFEGRNIAGMRPDSLARHGLVRTFQISRELGELTVLENMLLASPTQCGDAVWRNFLSPGRVDREQRQALEMARRYLEQVNLWALANEPAKNLSGGQKKLLEISRALMLQPRLILLDEPTAGVSPLMNKLLAEIILKLRVQGLTFAIVEHNMEVIAELCDPIYVLAEGRTLTSGTFRDVTANREVMHAYLGQVA